MANQDKSLNSGLAVYPPNRMLPNLENPINSIKTNAALIVITYSQLKFLLIAAFVFAKNSADTFGCAIVKILKPSTSSAETTDTNTFMSRPKPVKFRE